jgi:hypothetical protein
MGKGNSVLKRKKTLILLFFDFQIEEQKRIRDLLIPL